jgi:hypothetical protein
MFGPSLNFIKRSNNDAFRYRRRSTTSVGDLPSVRDSKSPNHNSGRRMRVSMALEPKSYDSKTPITGEAQSRVSVSLASQSWADAESDQRLTPTWLSGHEPSGYPSKLARFICQKAAWKRTACKVRTVPP